MGSMKKYLWKQIRRDKTMRILHYALGFPPYRSGGLTKWCVDLMIQQAKEGHCVAMLWPGQMGMLNKKIAIKKQEDVCLKEQRLQSFEVINPLPVSFDEGIADFSAFTANAGTVAYDKFLDAVQPDVIHVHTLMGLHKSFLQAAKRRRIRLIFTAHDFFPVCPKVTMFRHGVICSNVKNCEECGVCNATALSLKKIQILQSPLYRRLKDSFIVKKLRKKHRDGYLSEATADDSAVPVGSAEDYKKLRNNYYSLLKLMDIIHYNSSVTKSVYEAVFDLPKNCIVTITHADITDNRRIKKFSNDQLHIRYLGPQSGAKGYFLLKEALDQLWEKKQNFCLDVHFQPIEMAPYMEVHPRYAYEELTKIFEQTDVLVTPSIWFETFGFTVLEALSYGVPVVISGTVGAKDILVDGAGIVVDNLTPDRLCDTLINLTTADLKKMNEIIVQKQPIMQIEAMSKQIETDCYGWNL